MSVLILNGRHLAFLGYFTVMASDDRTFGRAGIPIERLKRAARLYHTNADAANALGITARSLSRLCRQHGLETPYVRRRRSA